MRRKHGTRIAPFQMTPKKPIPSHAVIALQTFSSREGGSHYMNTDIKYIFIIDIKILTAKHPLRYSFGFLQMTNHLWPRLYFVDISGPFY